MMPRSTRGFWRARGSTSTTSGCFAMYSCFYINTSVFVPEKFKNKEISGATFEEKNGM